MLRNTHQLLGVIHSDVILPIYSRPGQIQEDTHRPSSVPSINRSR